MCLCLLNLLSGNYKFSKTVLGCTMTLAKYLRESLSTSR